MIMADYLTVMGDYWTVMGDYWVIMGDYWWLGVIPVFSNYASHTARPVASVYIG